MSWARINTADQTPQSHCLPLLLLLATTGVA